MTNALSPLALLWQALNALVGADGGPYIDPNGLEGEEDKGPYIDPNG